jgi:hypothetical protein
VTSDDDLVDVGEVVLVGVPCNQLIKDLVRRDGLGLGGVLVGTAASPLRSLPYKYVGPGLGTSRKLLRGSGGSIVPVRV